MTKPETTKVVPDIITSNLDILFIGFNPGLRSAQTGHHFAGPSNRFWRLLAQSGLTPRLLKPTEDRNLLQFGMGIINIIDRPTRTAAELTKAEFVQGRQWLLDAFAVWTPKIACYAGIGVYREFTGNTLIACGVQSPGTVSGIIDFVVPSPSGLNRIPLSEQLNFYMELRKIKNSA